MSPKGLETFIDAAQDRRHIRGWTHNFYRYPARFSPQFAAAAIEHFSGHGDLILDPYMGGGTLVVEGMAAGRRVIGNDLNSLATFVTKVKTTPLRPREVSALDEWSTGKVPEFSYYLPLDQLREFIHPIKTKNLSLVRARFIKKTVAAALASLSELPTKNAQDFAKCVLLRVGQWALDGRERHTSLSEFRHRLTRMTGEMLESIDLFAKRIRASGGQATLLSMDTTNLQHAPIFSDTRERPTLVVTSPPYPGVHVLYHRWQVDGRRETPAPYWITGCNDGQGASFYNFGDRRQAAADNYFRASLLTLKGIRKVLRKDGYMVQLVAFNRPAEQLGRYLDNMKASGFAEVSMGEYERIWRDVPNRKWHANLCGQTNSSREVVLVHRAV